MCVESVCGFVSVYKIVFSDIFRSYADLVEIMQRITGPIALS